MRYNCEKTAAKLHATTDQGRILDTLGDVRKSIESLSDYDLLEQWHTLNDNYSLLLEYFGKGIADPQRQQQIDSMRRRLHSLIDKVCAAQMAADPHKGPRLDKWHTTTASHDDIANAIENYIAGLTLGDAQSKDIDRIASLLQTADLDKADLERLREGLLLNPAAPEAHKEYCIGVLADNTCHVFSQTTAIFLIETLLDEDTPAAVAARAAVGTVASMITWPARWKADKALAFLADEIATEHPKAHRLLKETTLSFFKTLLTSTITKFMMDGLGKELGKIAAKIIENKGKKDKYEIRQDEIREIFGDSPGVIDKFDQLAHWQKISADIAYTAYKRLKTDAFFNQEVHWLKPFDTTDARMLETLRNDPSDTMAKIASLLGKARNFCDSDKYSMMFSLALVPSSDLQNLKDNIANETQAMTDMLLAENPGRDGETRMKANLFVQDLYRYCNLRPETFGAPELFSNVADFADQDIFHTLFSAADELEAFGRKLVDMRLWQQACQTYARLEQGEGAADPEILRKYACCLFETAQEDLAYKTLRKAELVDDQNIWTKTRIAEYLFRHGNYEQAQEYYKTIGDKRQLSKSQTANSVKCLLELHRYAEALDLCNRSLLADDCPAAIRRAKAICLANLGRLKEAYDYARTLDTEGDPDYLITLALLAFSSADFPLLFDAMSAFKRGRYELDTYLGGRWGLMTACHASRQDLVLALEYATLRKQ